MKQESKKCPTCGKKAHNFIKEEALDCVPPEDTLKFGDHINMNKEYREELYKEYPFYTAEEVVGSYLGHNPNFPSESEWYEKKYGDNDEEE